MITKLSPKELMAWIALAIAIVLFSVSVSIAQTTTLVREGNQVNFKYSSPEGKNRVNIDTSFTANSDEEFEKAMEQISDRNGLDLKLSTKFKHPDTEAGDRDEHFSYRMKVNPKIDKKKMAEMNKDIREAMQEVHKSMREIDESLKEIHFNIYTDGDGDDETFNFDFSMPPMPELSHLPQMNTEANLMTITMDSDDDGNVVCQRKVSIGDGIDSLDDEKHVIVFGGKDEDAPVLEKTIIKKNGKKVFIYKRSEGNDAKSGKDDDNHSIEKLECYPNPSNGQITVSFKAKEEGDVKIQIVNAEGKEIYKISMHDFSGDYSNSFKLDSKGNYIVKVSRDGEVLARKIVVN